MVRPKDVLSKDEYNNYRNVWAVALLYIVLGGIFVLGGLSSFFLPKPALKPGEEPPPPAALMVAIGIVGLAGALGGIATISGSRRWSLLIYVMAAVYLFAFPVGTILSLVLLRGLSGYFRSLERIKEENELAVDG